MEGLFYFSSLFGGVTGQGIVNLKFFFLKTITFLGSFRFTAELEGKSRVLLYSLCPTCAQLPASSASPPDGTSVRTDETHIIMTPSLQFTLGFISVSYLIDLDKCVY